ncbi:MAG: ABC transporter substrate-binding protein [Bifidobacteriaceae bacterium]|jgi:peptide/nickel transport system substrate-binding protein|nr:ABC transporter substrate-binding protein [Bifidobacteriaceae bacterium]MCI1978426.1 ABC transporter substrate-binding protein [Bifidobacteriaceae bacterium]
MSNTTQGDVPEEAAQTAASGSTDASLASQRKSSRTGRARTSGPGSDGGQGGGNHNRGKWIAGIIIAVVVVVAVILGVVWSRRTTPSENGASGTTQETMTVGLKLAPTNMDIRNQSGSALDQVLIDNIYEPLVGRNAENKTTAGLAKSWDVSDDATTYTFHLNEGMTFSNGDALDSEDVVWSLNQLLEKKYAGYDLLRNIDSIAAQDANTVVIKLTAPYSDLLWSLSGRPGLVFDKDAQYDAKTEAIGSGPYLLKSFRENDSVTLERNENYWGTKKATIKTIILRYYADDNAALNAFKSGSIQVLAPVMNAKMTSSLTSDDRFVVGQGDGTDKYVLGMNNKGTVLSNIKVRQAIRYAINHDEIIASRGGVDAALGGPIPSLDPGYEDLTDLYPHNVNKAKELLKEAGYDDDNPLTLRLEYANTYGTEFGEQLKSQLKEVGIDLQVKVVEFSTWLQDVYTNHDYDLSLVDHNESHDFYQWADPTYYYGYDSKEVQDLYAKSLAATDESQQEEYLKQAARKVSEDAAADWLLNYRVTTAYDKGVTGFPMNLNQSRLPLASVDYKK